MRAARCLSAVLFAGCAAEPGDVRPPVDEVVVPTTAPITIRPLTAQEVRRTVEEAFGAPLADGILLPADSLIDGFDNQAASAPWSSVDLARLEGAMTEVVARFVAAPRARLADVAVEERVDPDPPPGLPSGWDGRITLPADGVWEISVSVQFALETAAREAILAVDGVEVAPLSFPDGVDTLQVTFPAREGAHTVAIWGWRSSAAADAVYAYYEGFGPITVSGPIDEEPSRAARDRLIACDLEADTLPCVREVITALAPRAWRRPLVGPEVDELLSPASEALALGATPDEALADSLLTLLLSPAFLLHTVRDTSDEASDGLARAARLAYLVTAGPPDEALAARAAAGELADPAVVVEEARRLLASPDADALIDGFFSQWLELGLLDELAPASDPFPAYTEALGASMRVQVRELVRRFVVEDRDLLGLVDEPSAWVDPLLAAWTGVDAPAAPGLVDLSGVGRGGLIGLPGVLAMLSPPDRTSPTRRGAWVMRHLLCDEVADPPPAIPPLESGGEQGALSVAEQLAEHAANPSCAVCHDRTDPVGVALERFDGTGRWRDEDRGQPIIAAGRTPDGVLLDGLPALRDWVVADPRFPACVVHTTLTRALGRRPDDPEVVRRVTDAWEAGGRSFADLIAAIVVEPSFLTPGRP